jgi:hypothetical protein
MRLPFVVSVERDCFEHENTRTRRGHISIFGVQLLFEWEPKREMEKCVHMFPLFASIYDSFRKVPG